MRRLHFLINGRLLATDKPENWTVEKVRALVKHLQLTRGTTNVEIVLK